MLWENYDAVGATTSGQPRSTMSVSRCSVNWAIGGFWSWPSPVGVRSCVLWERTSRVAHCAKKAWRSRGSWESPTGLPLHSPTSPVLCWNRGTASRQEHSAKRAWRSGSSLAILGRLALQQGDVEWATRCYQESLILSQEMGEQQGIAAAMEGLARTVAVRGQARSAARLFGTAAALRTTMGAPLPPSEHASYARVVAGVRADLHEAAFANAWTEGQAMPLGQAVAAALQGREQRTPTHETHTVVASPTPSAAIDSKGNAFSLTARELEVLHLVSLG